MAYAAVVQGLALNDGSLITYKLGENVNDRDDADLKFEDKTHGEN
jgi:hypothetical protein